MPVRVFNCIPYSMVSGISYALSIWKALGSREMGQFVGNLAQRNVHIHLSIDPFVYSSPIGFLLHRAARKMEHDLSHTDNDMDELLSRRRWFSMILLWDCFQ